jgi:hypothetical protein
MPIPELPECDLCQATAFFEHVHDAIAYFDAMDAKLSRGGLLVTGVMNHHPNFMHVTPDLGALRASITNRQYEALVEHRVFRKP